MTNLPIRGRILEEAAHATLKARNDVYGDPFPDMDLAASLKALYDVAAKGRYHQAHDEAMSRVFIKIARIASGAFHEDNYVDAAAYMAIAAECHHASVKADVSAQNQIAGLTPGEIKMLLSSDFFVQPGPMAESVSLVTEDPINRDTALPAKEAPAVDLTYKHIPVVGMRFKTQESSVIIWEIIEVYDPAEDGVLWFRSARCDRPPNSLSPEHFRERMPASAIHSVV